MKLTVSSAPVATVSHAIYRSLGLEGYTFTQLMCDAMCDRMRDLVKLLPMLDELCVLGLTGTQLHLALENGVSQYPKLEGRWPCVSGVSFEYDSTKPGGSRIDPTSITVNGDPLDINKEYAVATSTLQQQLSRLCAMICVVGCVFFMLRGRVCICCMFALCRSLSGVG